MRLFEILILLFNVSFILWGLSGRARPKWVLALPLLAAVLLLPHAVWEGMRWQMAPAYGITAVSFLIALVQWRRTTNARPGRMRLWSGLGLLAWLPAALLPALLPVPDLPPLTGDYAVGTRIVYLQDTQRPEIFSDDPNDVRELMLQVWYPAVEDGSGKPAVYLESIDVVGPTLAEQFGLPSFLLNHLNLIDLEITKDAAAVDGRFPLLVFVHGLGGVRVQQTSLMRALASHGYVVAALDHVYANAITVFPDDRAIVYDPCRVFVDCDADPEEGNRLVGVWADDIEFLVNTMTGWNGEAEHWLNGRLNLDQIGVFGHSTGGGAMIEFCQRDGRCDAGLGLDAWVLPASDALTAPGLRVPMLFISTPIWLGNNNRAGGERLVAGAQADAYDLRLANTQHYDFSDISLLSPLTPQLGLTGTIDGAYSLEIQSRYVLAFFDRYVRGEDAPLLDEPSPYPELSIERRTP